MANPPNTAVLATRLPDDQWSNKDGDGGANGPFKSANNAMDGSGTFLTVFTADVDNGGRVRFLRAKAAGSNVQSVLRIWIEDSAGTTRVLHEEQTLPQTTASANSGLQPVEVPLNIDLAPGQKLKCTLGTTVAAGWYLSVIGGKY